MTTVIYALAFALAASAVAASKFTFVALGDMPYGKPEDVYEPYKALIRAVNKKSPSLVVHVGDIKSGSTLCSDQALIDQLNFLNSFSAPTLYTPGDNEWTDCHRPAAGEFYPIERLRFLRKTFFSNSSFSFGKRPISVMSQESMGYPENARVVFKDVMFITAHVVGSNNNFEIRDINAVNEFFKRDMANLKWLKESFAMAKNKKAIVLGIHADMFEFDWDFKDEKWLRHSGFKNFGELLQEEAAAFGKPILMLYGDSHVYRQLRPFPEKAQNLMSVEVFGAQNMHAVEIGVDTNAPGIFSVTKLPNPALMK